MTPYDNWLSFNPAYELGPDDDDADAELGYDDPDRLLAEQREAEHDAEPVTLTYPEAVALRRDLARLREHDEAAAERLDSLLSKARLA